GGGVSRVLRCLGRRWPTTSLSSYGKFELKPMEMVDDVADDAAKAPVAKDLEARIQERMRPIFKRWSGATRFFAGAFAGDSSIAMDLQLRDAATGAVVANPTIVRNASAFAGAYSVGSTDQ